MRGFRRSGRRIAPCLVALAFPSAAVAQDTFPLPAQPSPPYVERVWRTVDGLPHDIVWTVLQTRDGYLWLGIQSGLARFDGDRLGHPCLWWYCASGRGGLLDEAP